ncbi:hypothetical protein C2E25_13280 [Geothermobacter hydrogeniphilus]|uniref:Uncharacterized protein n=1 Tax=Geothermobacter hydrogeniphilus TaxID=1969733 RepID=A0A2K2H7S8_9BACT|nr:hypothetical protein [Geothermobacter hydrogeniphilus]PNU19309.1 hypothetical protein C2E25_13280 [Geothermobacter hydrogeniphilus]
MNRERMQIHLDPQLCRQCGGLCCQGHPGCWADPQRFAALFFAGHLPSLEKLRTRIADLGLQLRDYSGVPVPAPRSNEQGCVFLGKRGCRLDEEQRPCQCLGLIPELETLTSGEIHCRLPGKLSYGTIRANWQQAWNHQGQRDAVPDT